jgi:hypothetical protein
LDIKIRNKGSERPSTLSLIITLPQPINKVVHNQTSISILLEKKEEENIQILEVCSLSLKPFLKMDREELILFNAFLGVIDNL